MRSYFAAILILCMMAFAASTFADEVITITATVPGVTGGGDPGGGGGGGGGGGILTPTSVAFSGRAYPLSKVTVLRDGVVAITTIAGPDARFNVTLDGLNGGNYTFSVYSEDAQGRRSSPFSFPLYLTDGATTTVSGIFITPTIDVDKTEVKLGDNISIFGIAAPQSAITISVHSPVERFFQTTTDENGAYLYTLDTSPLELGGHNAKSKALLLGTASEYGTNASFTVGDKNVNKDKNVCGRRGDMNQDCKVNIVDFSILAYWYKRANVPTDVDLNADGKITIVDFSILAYYWTG